MKKSVMLIIRDGWGINKNIHYNAVYKANTPFTDYLKKTYPWIPIKTSGLAVGLPEGQMGNSEVGHLNLGAGRIVYQEITRIDKAIEDGSFFKNEEFLKAIKNVKDNNSSLHLLGLLSDGGVHSHINHLKALLRLCKDNGINRVYVHAFLDGRDVPPRCADIYIRDLESFYKKIGIGAFASVSGRYYAMDRDKRWDRTKLAYDALTLGEGLRAKSAIDALNKAYDREEDDEFVKPTVIEKNNKPVAVVDDNDSVIFFNFRPDRARQLTYAFNLEEFSGFNRERFPKTYYVCMTLYDEAYPDIPVAFKKYQLKGLLGEVISKEGLKQLRIAETEKYAHVTYFFNGGEEQPFDGEDRVLIPSPKVATYDLKPEMSAYEVMERVLEEISKDKYSLIVLNFANGDMVGHTGVFDAAVKAIETVDACMKQIYNVFVKEKNGILFITSDHGNAEKMWDDKTNSPYTAHTTFPVEFFAINVGNVSLRDDGKLADIAPTILHVLGIDKPDEMTGESLLSIR